MEAEVKLEVGQDYRMGDKKVRLLYIQPDAKADEVNLLVGVYAHDGSLTGTTKWVEESDLHPLTPAIYINLYGGGIWDCHRTKKLAESNAVSGRLSCIRVELTEGRFDA